MSNESKTAAALAESLNPYGVLARGYAVVRRGGLAVGSVSGVAADDEIDIQFTDGSASARVLRVAHKDHPAGNSPANGE